MSRPSAGNPALTPLESILPTSIAESNMTEENMSSTKPANGLKRKKICATWQPPESSGCLICTKMMSPATTLTSSISLHGPAGHFVRLQIFISTLLGEPGRPFRISCTMPFRCCRSVLILEYTHENKGCQKKAQRNVKSGNCSSPQPPKACVLRTTW